ncbi:MAG: SRPBCC family protein [Bdellovibrionales bacterium]
MNRTLKNILKIIAVLIVVFLAIAAFLPGDYRVERKTSIAASPAAIFPHINDHRKMAVWSPWVKMDPEVKLTYSGPRAGKGAVVAWDGDRSGAGTSTIADSKYNKLVKYNLVFTRPFEATSTAEISLAREGGKTTVTWVMFGTNNYVGKVIGLVMNCEKMISREFDKGLADLKATVEKR